MNYEVLLEAEASFLQMYPKGFADPALEPVRKKHNVDKLVEFTQQNLTQTACNKPHFVADTLVTIISRSSMVSRFEKPPFKQFINSLTSNDREALAFALEQRLFGRKQQGFETIVGMLAHYKLAKWAVVSAVPFYFAPRREVFVKPTTAKRILAALEIEDIQYKPTPSWEFYKGYRKLLTDIRKQIDPSLAPNNAALSGFLMMTVENSQAP